jgi:hypothetical protein
MKTVVIFQSELFDHGDPYKREWVSFPPLGKDCAQFLLDKYVGKGATVQDEQPEPEDEGWSFDVALSRHSSTLLVHGISLGEIGTKQDYWVVRIDMRRGCLIAIFGKRTYPDEVQPICTLLDDILREDDRMTNVRWLSDNEYAKLR